MDIIKLKAKAKINLSIDINGLLENGYHDVSMIMQSVNLSDYIIIRKAKEGFRLTSSSVDIPSDDKNIMARTWNLLKNRYKIDSGLEIFLEKNIPVAAGMAGGSADSAAAFIGINRLFELGLSDEELLELSKELGSDIAFCLKGGTYLATGTGTDLEKLCPLSENIRILICKPNVFVSTKSVYKKFDKMYIRDGVVDDTLKRPDNESIIKGLREADEGLIISSMSNVLEDVTKTWCKDIEFIEEKMMEYGAKISMMSGSGPTVFGFFDDNNGIKKCSSYLRKRYPQTFVTKASYKGVEICGHK